MLSPCPDEMHFSATQKRRRAISRAEKYDFRAISWNNASDEETRATLRVESGDTLRCSLPRRQGGGETIRKLMVLRVVIAEE